MSFAEEEEEAPTLASGFRRSPTGCAFCLVCGRARAACTFCEFLTIQSADLIAKSLHLVVFESRLSDEWKHHVVCICMEVIHRAQANYRAPVPHNACNGNY